MKLASTQIGRWQHYRMAFVDCCQMLNVTRFLICFITDLDAFQLTIFNFFHIILIVH